MPLLYYWRHDNYVHDLGQGGAAYHLNQRSARLHRVDIGDSLGNKALLCPNDHRSVHARDALFDFADDAFVFNGERRRLRINEHLGVLGN